MAIAVTDVATTIATFIKTEFRIADDDPDFGFDVNLFEAGYVDSVGLIELIAFLESTFEVKLGEEHLFSEAFTSINGIASVVTGSQSTPAPGAAAYTARDGSAEPVRPWTRADVPAVVALYEEVMRSGTRNAPPGLSGYFERWFLDHPFADADLPSFVFEDKDGKIRGFLGSHVRRFTFDGKPLRAVCSGQLIVDKESRAQGVGAHLLRALFRGPQDFTFTDGGTPELRTMWTGLGGNTVPTGYVRWTKIFKPAGLAVNVLQRRKQGLAPLAFFGKPIAAGADLAASMFREKEAQPRGTHLSPHTMLACLEELAPQYRLAPAYDEPFLEWTATEMRRLKSRGAPRALEVRDGGKLIGTYVYYSVPGGISRAVQVAAAPGREQEVLQDLIADAKDQGAQAIQGRAESCLLKALYDLRARIDFDASLQLLHAKDPALAQAVHDGTALMTRLEGEWWAGFQLEPFDEAIPST